MSLSPAKSQILTAFFDSRSQAKTAIDRILREGIPRDVINIVEGADASGEKHRKSFFEKLGSLFMPAEDRQAYAEGLRRGGFLVSVPTHPANHDRVRDILDEEGTVDMAARERSWRQEGWAGTEAEYDALRSVETGTDRSALFQPPPNFTLPASGSDPAARFGLQREEFSATRTRSYVLDDLEAEALIHKAETEALGYPGEKARTGASQTRRQTEIELDDLRMSEEERLRAGDRNR